MQKSTGVGKKFASEINNSRITFLDPPHPPEFNVEEFDARTPRFGSPVFGRKVRKCFFQRLPFNIELGGRGGWSGQSILEFSNVLMF